MTFKSLSACNFFAQICYNETLINQKMCIIPGICHWKPSFISFYQIQSPENNIDIDKELPHVFTNFNSGTIENNIGQANLACSWRNSANNSFATFSNKMYSNCFCKLFRCIWAEANTCSIYFVKSENSESINFLT